MMFKDAPESLLTVNKHQWMTKIIDMYEWDTDTDFYLDYIKETHEWFQFGCVLEDFYLGIYIYIYNEQEHDMPSSSLEGFQ